MTPNEGAAAEPATSDGGAHRHTDSASGTATAAAVSRLEIGSITP